MERRGQSEKQCARDVCARRAREKEGERHRYTKHGVTEIATFRIRSAGGGRRQGRGTSRRAPRWREGGRRQQAGGSKQAGGRRHGGEGCLATGLPAAGQSSVIK